MANTSTVEEYGSSSPVLEQLSPTLEKQVADILQAIDAGATDADLAPAHGEPVQATKTENALSLGYSVPMAGVRYYTYL